MRRESKILEKLVPINTVAERGNLKIQKRELEDLSQASRVSEESVSFQREQISGI